MSDESGKVARVMNDCDMPPIRLLPEHFSVECALINGGEWISNAYWMIRRERVENAALFATQALAEVYTRCSTRELSFDAAAMVRESRPVTRFEWTHWQHKSWKGSEPSRLFVAAGGLHTVVQQAYLDLFGYGDHPHVWYGQEDGTLLRDDVENYSIVLMPLDTHTLGGMRTIPTLVQIAQRELSVLRSEA